MKILIANRGEIAVRIARAVAELGLESFAVFTKEDARSLHVVRADASAEIPSYLDGDAILTIARKNGCDALHPGYGFLSESGAFARKCADAGVLFIGPTEGALSLFGDKAAARRLARAEDVPLAAGTQHATSLEEARAFQAKASSPIMLKALMGGGGRGIRVVDRPADLDAAFERAASEARAAFGSADLYVEEVVTGARHVEIQILGDQAGNLTHLFERECSLQRRRQKVVEIAPAPGLEPRLRDAMIDAALRLARAAKVHALCTFEFLVDPAAGRFVFMEANPRLQVEHTVTEEILGVDLVKAQIALASGKRLEELGLAQRDIGLPRGVAVQLRVNMERIGPDGNASPTGGVLRAFDPPSGAGIRVDTFGYAGYETTTSFDPLLAKVIAHVPQGTLADALRRAYRALCEFRIDGVGTNLGLLQALTQHSEVQAGKFDTRFVESHLGELLGNTESHPRRFATSNSTSVAAVVEVEDAPAGTEAVRSPMGGRVVAVPVREGDVVAANATLVVIEAMKMEQAITAIRSGVVRAIRVEKGQSVAADQAVIFLEPTDAPAAETKTADGSNEADLRPLLEALEAHRAALLDHTREAAVAKYKTRRQLTARERIAYLTDKGSFHEIGGLARTEGPDGALAPADGVVAGSAKIDGRPVMVLSQDFMTFGGSAGRLGMVKMDRLAHLAVQQGLPLVMILDGGGHRVQDGQSSREYAPSVPFFQFATRLSGWAPMVSAILGEGFAANTNFSSMSDFVVMVRGQSTMGLAGPALVRAGTGEDTTKEALGGASLQVDRQGLADHGANSEEEALDLVKGFLSYLPTNASIAPPVVPGQISAAAPEIAGIVPPNSRKTYDMRAVIAAIADAHSVFELKPTFARNVITSFARMDGRPVGFIANQPLVMGGMLDSPGSEKVSHFIAVCDAFGLPLIYLMDIPGMSIGPAAEKTTLGRRSAKVLFELGLATVPRISVVLRKGYGLGYAAMNGGRSFDPDACFAWPTAEICAMSIEGAVDVAFRRDYEKAPDPAARRQEIIDGMRAQISPFLAAEGFGVDDVIAPGETRARLLEVLGRAPLRRRSQMPPKFRSIPPI